MSASPSSLAGGVNDLTTGVASSGAFSAASRSMLELGVSSAIGAGCVQGQLLDPTTISALAKTTFSILLPMFLGTSIVKTISLYGINRSSFLVPLLGVIQPLILLQIAKYILLPIFAIDFDSDDGRCMAVCCAWGNTSVLPLIFCESLFRYSSSPAVAYDRLSSSYAQISLFLVGWSPTFWSVGRSVLMGNGGNESFKQKLERCTPPPVLGVLVGMLVALTPLCHLFVCGTSEQKAPLLSPVYNTVVNLGKAASPTSLLVMTSSLAFGAGVGKDKGESIIEAKAADVGVGFLRQWLCVSTARFILSPALMFGLLQMAEKCGLIERSSENPMLWFVMILQSCMPPAQNLILMLNVADKAKKAGETAKFLFSIYATSMMPVIIVLSFALEKLGLA
mmetsp:Transcript_13525/g.29378  ORF Transcript_13525/g.29378 Transcript_13525/m.29378 type:complete len:393 (-) Transcript_13525:96-1274(-)